VVCCGVIYERLIKSYSMMLSSVVRMASSGISSVLVEKCSALVGICTSLKHL
jgi:hypothetical protein